jgi:hypothetical protein
MRIEQPRLLARHREVVHQWFGATVPMTIERVETLLVGKCDSREGRVVGDNTCVRIDELVRTHLKALGRDTTGWDALFRDPEDGRLWELTYPQSELHGGGPPQLRCLLVDEARAKYGGVVDQPADPNFHQRDPRSY